MSGGIDMAIKVFGRKMADFEYTFKEKANTEGDTMLDNPEYLDQKESISSSGSGSSIEEVPKTSTENVAKEAEKLNSEQDNKEIETSGEEKILKKPDKVIPCPRCNSMDTKFCYYNNYNVNQPRHFCKKCQRYWTAGGTMRNVPVGAGRRKNKNSPSSFRHTLVTPDALTSAQLVGSDQPHHEASPCGSSSTKRVVPPSLKCNTAVLKFGPDAPLCESITSVLNLTDQKRASELGLTTRPENEEEPSCSSSVTILKPAENAFPEAVDRGYQNGLAPFPHLQCFPLPPWAYAWNPAWNSVVAAAATRSSEPLPEQENGFPSPMSWSQPPMMSGPAFCASTFPFPLVPAASFWGCMPSWTGGPWNQPMVGNNNGFPTSNINCPGNGSPTLGKHCRDAALNGDEKTEKSLWLPKTSRIDDIDEAAKSSIFATLGIKPDEGGLFKAFPSKSRKGEAADPSQLLHANPAAFSRSQTFNETTT